MEDKKEDKKESPKQPTELKKFSHDFGTISIIPLAEPEITYASTNRCVGPCNCGIQT